MAKTKVEGEGKGREIHTTPVLSSPILHPLRQSGSVAVRCGCCDNTPLLLSALVPLVASSSL